MHSKYANICVYNMLIDAHILYYAYICKNKLSKMLWIMMLKPQGRNIDMILFDIHGAIKLKLITKLNYELNIHIQKKWSLTPVWIQYKHYIVLKIAPAHIFLSVSV